MGALEDEVSPRHAHRHQATSETGSVEVHSEYAPATLAIAAVTPQQEMCLHWIGTASEENELKRLESPSAERECVGDHQAAAENIAVSKF